MTPKEIEKKIRTWGVGDVVNIELSNEKVLLISQVIQKTSSNIMLLDLFSSNGLNLANNNKWTIELNDIPSAINYAKYLYNIPDPLAKAKTDFPELFI
jgi:hypothetical protein